MSKTTTTPESHPENSQSRRLPEAKPLIGLGNGYIAEVDGDIVFLDPNDDIIPRVSANGASDPTVHGDRSTSQHTPRAPRTTTKQWRNYFEPAPRSDLPGRTKASDEAAAVVLSAYLSEAEERKNAERNVSQGVLRDPKGRAVLGSRGWTSERIEEYLADNPDARIE